ncbi:MAG: macrocin-O-methyltransferase [Oscillospiraceae bacterium]|jgi:O-methyltransferase|nr:macrocin-O-methyltransferase [Oscillospiraceae bacterium]
MKYVIFGAGGIGRRAAVQMKQQGKHEITAFADNDKQKQGTDIDGIPVYAPDKLPELEYDRIFVTPFAEDITSQLLEMGIDGTIIEAHEETPIITRKQWLTDFADVLRERGVSGSVAEAGVFRGDFAKHINAVFPDRTLYLFDTFEGFPESDVAREALPSAAKPGNYGYTSVDVVTSKLPHPENAVIRKGYFPESASGIDDTFCFVNLDLDLYQPTYEGLKYFYGKVAGGGGHYRPRRLIYGLPERAHSCL